MSYPLLEKINSPEDLRALSERDIAELCSEIRAFLIENAELHGGHLASNLGVVELTVALHRVFDSPRDHIIFDVGHQSYVHKLITGRRERFSTLRQPGGLSGFTLMRESEHDAFGAGHSSTSISAALGYAEADAILGKRAYSISVTGDGAYTGGLVHEALNNVNPELPLIIVLNENRMSISQNKGAFARYLSRIRVSKSYVKFKRGTRSVLEHIPLIGKPISAALSWTKKKIKHLIYSTNYFEELGLYYIGPVNGNDYKAVRKVLLEAKNLGKSVVVHIHTKKGKGYSPAERSPDDFHSVSSKKPSSATFHSVFADKLKELAATDARILAVTAAMGIGTGLDSFGKSYPDRYFDVGIAEEHALTFSAALAADGMKPFVAIYSTFLQRAYDNIIHDVALQSLPVRMMIDRAGLAVGDGATHHGIFDVAFLSEIPNIKIVAPVTYGSLRAALDMARDATGPIAVRYANKSESERAVREFYPNGDFDAFGVRASFSESDAPRCVLITYGSIIDTVLEARDIAVARGESVGVILVESIKPYADAVDKIYPLVRGAERIIYVEEGIKCGGAAMISRSELYERHPDLKSRFDIIAIDDSFASPTEPCELYSYLGLSAEKIAERILEK
ncbi:MAG: 1-deoxy-D-xylulose-5-phosphate synthase [Clostridia bacterium]|nr:1-deoxy-D-xylulose-5-phosphate synthase [Clostridia bacterium]